MSLNDESRLWEVEPFNEGDEDEILSLFNLVFQKTRTKDHWSWKYRDNPYSTTKCSVARTKDTKKLIGNQIVIPFLLNVEGAAFLAAQAVDTLCHPDFRKQGVFEKTGKEVFKMCAEQGFSVIVAFPNEQSLPGFIKKQSWVELFSLKHYLLRIGIKNRIFEKTKNLLLSSLAAGLFRLVIRHKLGFQNFFLKNRVSADYIFDSNHEIPSGYEVFWNRCKSDFKISFWKDSKYLNWRYGANPDRKFKYLSLKLDNQIVAFAIAVDIKNRIILCEFLVQNQNLAVAQLFLNKICIMYLKENKDSVEFLGHDDGFFDRAFNSFSKKLSKENIFCGRSYQNDKLKDLIENSNLWTVTYGDADFV